MTADDTTPDLPAFETYEHTTDDDGTEVRFTFTADPERGEIEWTAAWDDQERSGYTEEISEQHGAIIYPHSPRINGAKTQGSKLDADLLDALAADLAAAQDHAAVLRAKRQDEPLTYTVEEYTTTSRAGGWGEQTFEKTRLAPSKPTGDMDERQRELHGRVDTGRVPDDAEPGDVLTFADLLDDPRTRDERDQDALTEAAETGQDVVISRQTAPCNDSREECSLDHVSKIATPDGEIETRRTHTW